MCIKQYSRFSVKSLLLSIRAFKTKCVKQMKYLNDDQKYSYATDFPL